MKISIEVDSEDAVVLASIHAVHLDKLALVKDKHPGLYSRAAKVTGEFLKEVTEKIPMHEMWRIRLKQLFTHD